MSHIYIYIYIYKILKFNTNLVGKYSTLRRKNGPKLTKIFLFAFILLSAVAEAEGIEPLIHTLNAQRDGAIANAATALTNLATHEPFRISIQSCDLMNMLVEPLRSTNSQVQSKAALTVAAFGCDAEARTEVKLLLEVVVGYNISRS